MGSYLGYTGLMGVTITIICIALSFWALQIFRFDLFTFDPKSPQAKTLQIIISIILGYQLGQFLINYLGWSLNIINLF